MSSEAPCRREWLTFFTLVGAALAVLALRAPGTIREAHELTAAIERDGPAAATCGRALPGSGELAAALTALEALQGRDAGLGCAARRSPYLRFAAS